MLETLSRAEEFSQIKLRREEKKTLKEWNLSEEPIVRFKVTETRGKAGTRAVAKVIRTPAEKIFIATQGAMSDEFTDVHPPGMRLEVENVFTNGRRIMQGAARYYAKTTEGGFAACCNALRLSKALEMRAWDDTRFPTASDSAVRQEIHPRARRGLPLARRRRRRGSSRARTHRQSQIPTRRPSYRLGPRASRADASVAHRRGGVERRD